MINLSVYVCLIIVNNVLPIVSQSGPDPWHYDGKIAQEFNDEAGIPPDIRMPLKTKKIQSENKLGIGEWFYKRTLAIILKGGQAKKNEDGSMDVSLQMKFDPEKWDTLDECLKSERPMSEDMFRRTVGYVEESIYKPSIVEQIMMTWQDYVQLYLVEYKAYITWSLFAVGAVLGAIWLWSNMSHRHALIIIFIIFYAYEVFTSYKEAEQKELEKFVSAVDKCRWYFWRSDCEVPPPDPLVFIKHMNPMKIGIRMFTSALAEPFVAISGTVDTILHGVTDGVWYPFNKVTYAILTVMINVSLIYFLIMVIFNYLLNIPFHLGFFGFGITLRQRERTLFSNTNQPQSDINNADRISQATVDRILNVCTLALSSKAQKPNEYQASSITPRLVGMRRSASTGRLPNLNLSFESAGTSSNVKRRNNALKIIPLDGSGDAR